MKQYTYDDFGWFSGSVDTDDYHPRATDQAPPDTHDGQQANWTGHAWLVLPYVEPVRTSTPAVIVWTKDEFIGLFTPAEWRKAEARALTDDIANQFMAILKQCPYVKSDNINVTRGLAYSEYLGDLDAGRADAITARLMGLV